LGVCKFKVKLDHVDNEEKTWRKYVLARNIGIFEGGEADRAAVGQLETILQAGGGTHQARLHL